MLKCVSPTSILVETITSKWTLIVISSIVSLCHILIKIYLTLIIDNAYITSADRDQAEWDVLLESCYNPKFGSDYNLDKNLLE